MAMAASLYADMTQHVPLFNHALIQLKEQELSSAFKTFLRALETVPKSEVATCEAQEAPLFEKALHMYLTQGAQDPIETANAILKEYESVALAHENYAHLNFLVATAYANLNHYEKFFHHFFKFYPVMHSSFLADKVKGILYLKLSLGEKEEKERMALKQVGLSYIEQAVTKNPFDPNLYKILIVESQSHLVEYVEKMNQLGVVAARRDLLFYVKELCELKQKRLAEELLNNARKMYTYSRQIEICQKYIEGFENG